MNAYIAMTSCPAAFRADTVSSSARRQAGDALIIPTRRVNDKAIHKPPLILTIIPHDSPSQFLVGNIYFTPGERKTLTRY